MKKVPSEEYPNIIAAANARIALFIMVYLEAACVLDMRLNISVHFDSA